MSTVALLWRAAADAARSGRVAAFATVCGQRGSLPMARHAKLLATEDGRRWGTVGGGCVESDVIAQAFEAARAGRPAVVRHTLNADLAGDVGLSCGGTVELVVEPIRGGEAMARLCEAVADAIDGRVPALVLTALDWSDGPQKAAVVGESMLTVGALRAPLIAHLTPGTSHLARCNSEPRLSDDASMLVEPIPRAPRLVLFGAGHVGLEIARLAAGAGFHVVVADDRAEFANAERFPWAAEVYAEPLGLLLDRITLDPDDFVVAATRGHQHDAEVIARTAPSAARYVGMLGSGRKREVVFEALRESGVPAEALERVRVPIGEPIGAETPAEIAVSVVAELIRVRRTG